MENPESISLSIEQLFNLPPVRVLDMEVVKPPHIKPVGVINVQNPVIKPVIKPISTTEIVPKLGVKRLPISFQILIAVGGGIIAGYLISFLVQQKKRKEKDLVTSANFFI